MNIETEVEQSVTRTIEWVALIMLVALAILSAGLALFVGPIMLIPVFAFALAALAVDQLVLRVDAIKEAELAVEGTHGPVTYWGTVMHTTGRCSSQRTLRPGASFTVAEEHVWPPLCEHADRAILATVARMRSDRNFTEAPIHFEDDVHAFDIDLYETHGELHAERAA
jgi:hypothetical protein